MKTPWKKGLVALFVMTVLGSVTVLPAAPHPAAATVEQETLVANLYREFAWEAVMGGLPTWETFINQPRGELEKFCDPRLTSLLIADHDEKVKTGELGKLDFCPLWDSQDPLGATELEINTGKTPEEVSVKFRYAGSNKKVALTFVMSKGKAGWRISDIRSPEWSLVDILSDPGNSQGK